MCLLIWGGGDGGGGNIEGDNDADGDRGSDGEWVGIGMLSTRCYVNGCRTGASSGSGGDGAEDGLEDGDDEKRPGKGGLSPSVEY